MSKSKWFRVASEGATTDGRAITRAEIQQMAASYNPVTYAARIWLEHYRGTVPGGPFDALGDVLAVKTQEDDGKLCLYAQIEPLPALLGMNKDGQKLYTSIEIHPNFPTTGGAYLFGLAVTDSPASLSTERLQFSNGAGFKCRKQVEVTLFTAGVPFTLELEEETTAPAGSGDASLAKSLIAVFTKALDKISPSNHSQQPAPAKQEPVLQPVQQFTPASGQDMLEAIRVMGQAMAAIAENQTKLEQQFATQKKGHEALVTKLSTEPANQPRQLATGGNGTELTDC